MKKGLLLAGSVLTVTIVVFATIFTASHYLTMQEQKRRTCTGAYITHTVTIKENVVSPLYTHGSLCDQLRIVNEDDATRLLAFGEHSHHQAYDGFTEGLVKRGQNITVVLDKTGTFKFHDHLDDEVHGYFIVTK